MAMSAARSLGQAVPKVSRLVQVGSTSAASRPARTRLERATSWNELARCGQLPALNCDGACFTELELLESEGSVSLAALVATAKVFLDELDDSCFKAGQILDTVIQLSSALGDGLVPPSLELNTQTLSSISDMG